MKRRKRILLILFCIGIVGLLVTSGVIVGTGTLIHREAAEVYHFNEPVSEIQVETYLANVRFVAQDEVMLETDAKAWLNEEFDMDELLKVKEEDGLLVISELPFEPNFLGVFPQPYELNLTLYAPQTIIDKLQTPR